MSDILSGLGIQTAVNPPEGDTNENTPPPAPNNFAAAAKDPQAAPALGVLKAVATGQMPGVLVPDSAPKINSPLTAADLTTLGLGLYRPHTKGLVGVVFNPKQVPLATLQTLDKKGRLEKAFPPITKFLNGKGAKGSNAVKTNPGAGVEAPAANASASGVPDAQITDTNLTGTPQPTHPQLVPVLPRPAFSADAQKKVALTRQNLINGNTAPSARPIPGAGSLLNGLTQSVV